MNTLGQRCRNLRLLHKWTQEELANKIGVTKQVVSNWERNVARPEINHLISLAEVFDVTTDYLLCIANQMTFPTVWTQLTQFIRTLITRKSNGN
ncbi:helix-turn-helix transcriptional regulator [Paenibacillus sp. FSL L8-0158]|uniref:helix-turn-helix domain-containing protein n=1 Tax=Paenibacillus sp. FSL L8-0158 TaxID=2954752 RepID=UPI003159436E